MKTTVRSETEKAEFIEFIQGTDIKGAYAAQFSKIRRKRSLSSNAYMWLLHTIEQEETGSDKDYVHCFLMNKFPTFEEMEHKGRVYLVPITSRLFNTKQMSVFIDNVRREMAVNGMETPDIEDNHAIDAFNYYREQGKL